MRKFAILLVTSLAAGLAIPPGTPVQAVSPELLVSYVVDDQIVGNCTLREAIKAAITNQAVDLCPAGSVSSVDAITLNEDIYHISIEKVDSSIPAVEAGGGDFDLFSTGQADAGIIIRGKGKDFTVIDGHGIDRLFHIHDSSVSLTLEDLTLRNGNYSNTYDNLGGGAIFNKGTLELNNVLITNNYTDVAGGGIDNRHLLTLHYTEFSNNTADYSPDVDGSYGAGGAIYNSANMLIENSLFTNNFAQQEGGAIVNDNNQGDEPGTAQLINVTISGNQSGIAGGVSTSGRIVLQNVTIFDNFSDEYPGAKNLVNGETDVRLIDSIIFSSAGDSANCEKPIPYTEGHNLINGISCGTQEEIISNYLDPVLKPLSNNGGPTRTHELLVGTPAVNGAGAAVCPPTDQRGILRPQGAACDIGAYELMIEPTGEGDSFVFLPVLRK